MSDKARTKGMMWVLIDHALGGAFEGPRFETAHVPKTFDYLPTWRYVERSGYYGPVERARKYLEAVWS